METPESSEEETTHSYLPEAEEVIETEPWDKNEEEIGATVDDDEEDME